MGVCLVFGPNTATKSEKTQPRGRRKRERAVTAHKVTPSAFWTLPQPKEDLGRNTKPAINPKRDWFVAEEEPQG
jgi:hypothetical protein